MKKHFKIYGFIYFFIQIKFMYNMSNIAMNSNNNRKMEELESDRFQEQETTCTLRVANEIYKEIKDKVAKLKDDKSLPLSILKQNTKTGYNLKHITLQEFKQKCIEEDGWNYSFNPNIGLLINLSKHNDLVILQKLSEHKMPDIMIYSFHDVPSSCDVVNTFMLCSIPRLQSGFRFNTPFSQDAHIVTPYFLCLREAATKFTQSFSVNKMIISNTEFCSLVKAAKKTENLVFYSCTILTNSVCDFGEMTQCNVKMIDFNWTGNAENSDWTNNEELCFNIISGIENCEQLKRSLKKFNLNYKCHPYEKNELRNKVENKFDDIEYVINMQFRFKTIDKA